jgi:hypothetical protein
MKILYVIENEEGYEALYVDDWIKDEARPLNEGSERVKYFLRLCERYDTHIELVRFGYCEVEEFPDRLSELKNIRWKE